MSKGAGEQCYSSGSVCVQRKIAEICWKDTAIIITFSALTFCLQTNDLFIEQVHIKGIMCGCVVSLLQRVIFTLLVQYYNKSKVAGLFNSTLQTRKRTNE